MNLKKIVVFATITFLVGGAVVNSAYVNSKDQETYASLTEKYNVAVINEPQIIPEEVASDEEVSQNTTDQEPQEAEETNVVKEDNRTLENIVWDYLKEAGYSDIQAAGIIGNLYQESGLQPNKVEYGTQEGIGLVQWSFGRKQQLINHCSSQGKDWTDLNCQLEFLVKELKSSQFYEPYLSTFNNPYSVDDAVEAFCFGFERPNRAKANLQYRKNMGWKAYYNNYNRK